MKPFNEHNEQAWDFKHSQELHGDVILEKVESLPKDFNKMKSEPKAALAYGEVTGHLHKLFRFGEEHGAAPAFDLRIGDDGIKWLKVDEPTVVKHQEHSPRVIPPGIYKIGIQREYDPFTKLARKVVD
jgi:hypothetical protein